MLRKITFFYERRVAPFLAVYAYFLYWPLYKYFKNKNVCFVVNIAGGVGHIICELDQFFRKIKVAQIDLSKKYYWIRKKDEYSKVCLDLYGNRFSYATCNRWLFYFLQPLLIRFKEITYDAGLSRLKWQLDSKGDYFLPDDGQTYLGQINKKEMFQLWTSYYSLCQKTVDYYPLKVKAANSLQQLLGDQKLVLLQLKEGKKNASACPTDPKTYIPTIQYLKKLGYAMVFAGREKIPHLFEEEGVINYANSKFASFRNDIELYTVAEFSINCGSGVAFLADSYDRPYLYINSWQLPMSMFSPKCIMIPTLVQNKSGSFLTFKEQMQLYSDLKDSGKEDFPDHLYIPRNASAEEILEGVKELLLLMNHPSPRDPLQEKWRHLNPQFPSFFSQARISSYFLKNHRKLFFEKFL